MATKKEEDAPVEKLGLHNLEAALDVLVQTLMAKRVESRQLSRGYESSKGR